jgi:ankyrin repeat protein
MGVPEHPHADALARRLLDRGAVPNDGQALYNTHLVGDDTRWLELLFRYGLGPADPIRWHVVPADAAKSGADRCPAILDYLLCGAAANGHVRRLALLLERGANPDARSLYDGKSAYEHALLHGSREAVELLLRHDATPSKLEGHDAFVAAVRAGDRARAERLLREHPDSRRIGDPLTEAAFRGETEVVRLLLELGVDPNAPSRHGHRALNNACQDREIARLLLAHGADPRARAFGGTACGWAWHAGNAAMARFLAEQSRSLLDAARSGHVELARELLAQDPVCIEERSPEGSGPLHELTNDPSLAEPLIALLLAHGADPDAKDDHGRTPVEALEERGGDEVADMLDAMRGA